jgi:3-oxoacyl-(acyl-carrier-protein) synthase
MVFVVTGNAENGAVATTCESAATALEKARSLIADGARDVLITDADGLQHALADFDRLFVAIPADTTPTT